MRVLLVHGLWRTPLSLVRLARRLREWGYAPEHFSYAAAAQSWEAILTRLLARLEALGAAGPYAAIGHSLGGVLLREAVSRLCGPPPRHLIMLGTPNQPPRLAGALAKARPYRWLTGECGGRLASRSFYASLPPPAIPYTIVAGTRGPRGRWSPFGPEPNDGLVAVSETRVSARDTVVTVPASHTFMMNHPGVQAAVRQRLDAVTW